MSPALALIAAFCCLSLLVAAVVGMLGVRSRSEERIRQRVQALRGIRPAIADNAPLSLRRSMSDGPGLIAAVKRLTRYDPALKPYGMSSWNVFFILAGGLTFVICYLLSKPLSRTAFLLAPILFVALVRLYAGSCAGRQRRLLFEQFPDALNLMVRGIRVGVPITQSISNVAENAVEPTRTQFLAVAKKLDIGVTLGEALAELSHRSPLPEYKFFAVALSLQSQTGGNISETLSNLAETIRKRVAARAKGHALTAEAKMSMYILGAMPFPLFATMLVMNYAYISPLFLTRGGLMILTVACTSWSTGILTMQYLIRRALT